MNTYTIYGGEEPLDLKYGYQCEAESFEEAAAKHGYILSSEIEIQENIFIGKGEEIKKFECTSLFEVAVRELPYPGRIKQMNSMNSKRHAALCALWSQDQRGKIVDSL